MKIKHTFTLYCVPFTLALFLVSCGTSGDGNGGESFEASDVSAANCADAAALNCFISQWDTTKTADGASYTNTIVLPLVENGEYDFYVDWGDETAIENITEFDAIEVTHTYAEEGEYTIHIAGKIKGWRFFVSEFNEEAGTDNDYGDAVKLLDVSQWGSLSLGNTDGRQFFGAENFNPTASDAPNLSETTSLFAAFKGATVFNGAIGNWNVSTITTMENMFWEAAAFDQDIGGWNVSSVTDMSQMFFSARAFDRDLSGWNVCKVPLTNNFNFAGRAPVTWTLAEKPNWGMACPGGDDGGDTITFADVSEANCADVDAGLSCFISVWNTENSGLGASDTSTVVLPLVESGTYDFYVDWGDGKEVEKITSSADATHTYTTPGEYTIHIAGIIKGWRFYSDDNSYGDAAKLTGVTQWGSLSLGNTEGRQFQGAENFNPTATDAPDLSETTDLSYAFNIASSFNADISDWDVSKVTDMSFMFSGASSFNNNGMVLDWDDKTSNVTDMDNIFLNASAFNQDISDWNVGKVTTSEDFATDSGLELNNVPFKFRGLETVSREQCEVNPLINCFISVWDTANVPTDTTVTGYSGTMSVKLPLVSEGTYDFYVNWGDGKEVEKITTASAATHEYATPGEYTIHIAGEIKGWRFFFDFTDQGDAAKLTDVTQWGSLSLGNTEGRQFQGAQNFNPTATDAPDLSETTSLTAAFTSASNFNADISDWDVSQVTTMNYMFNFATSFNNNGMVLDWDDKTSNVTNMNNMFNLASAFNQDISDWNVGKVTTSEDFATDSGLELNNVPFKFRGLETVSREQCEVNPLINCFISVWDTANVPSDEAITGFSGTKMVKLPLVSEGTYDFYVDWGDGKEVEKITSSADATHTYDTAGEKTIHIAGEIKGWRFFFGFTDQGDAAKLTDVTQWGSLSLGNTDGRQFQGAQNFNPTATDAPDLSETTRLTAAFTSASNFNADISDWNVGEVTDMNYMFNLATSFNNNGMGLEWDDKTSKVLNMNYMFLGASAFNQDISGWKVENVMTYVDFATDSGLITAHIPPKFRGANAVSKEVCEAKPELNCFISVWNTENSGGGASATNTIVLPLVSEGTYDFYVDWGDGEDVEKITSSADATHTYTTPDEYTIHITGTIKGWRFYVDNGNYGDAVKLLNVTQWGSLSLGNTDGRQFQGAANFNPTATDAPDVSETTSLHNAFNGASSFNADISDWDVGEVTDMHYMFDRASSFNNNGKPLDWGKETSKVTDMRGVFGNASKFNVDISDWDVSEVTDMGAMFRGASVFNQDICYWNVENVTQSPPLGFANLSALDNKNNPFKAECTARKSN